MSQRKIKEENLVWEMFRLLNPDPFFEGFNKSESPDFVKGVYGVELSHFMQNKANSPGGGDHEWETRYRDFSSACEVCWLDIYPGRPFPKSVYYIPRDDIRTLEGLKKFRGSRDKVLIEELVRFVGNIENKIEIYNQAIVRVGPTFGKYFQGICVNPSEGELSSETIKNHQRYGCWGYPRSAFGISVGSRVAEIVGEKSKSVSKYANLYSRLDLILYATGETCASTLAPWIGEELRAELVNPGYFNTIWLLDVPGNCLFSVPLKLSIN
jgi:hypothetical protein